MVIRAASILFLAGCVFVAPLALACAGDDYTPELSIVNTTPFELNVQLQQGPFTVDLVAPPNAMSNYDPGFEYTEAGMATATWRATTADVDACDPPVMDCLVDRGEHTWMELSTGFLFVDRTPDN